MSDKVSDWKMMWGAKVKVPCDMPDDILKDAISASIQILSTINSSASEAEAEESGCIEKIKKHMDEKWEPGWMVVCGRSFGSLVTHQANRFVYMYVGDRAVMIYKA